jgi:hypothetical protein
MLIMMYMCQLLLPLNMHIVDQSETLQTQYQSGPQNLFVSKLLVLLTQQAHDEQKDACA